jgi:hypothetical protein
VLDVHFVILGAAFGIYGTYAYLRDIVRGVTKPNRVTWLMWAIAPLLAFSVEINEGVGLRSLMTFVVGFGPLIIFVVSFFYPASAWQIGRLDWLCGGLSAAGLAAWLVTRHGTVAVVASIAADGLAAAPTLRKSWYAPQTETVAAYATAMVNAAITVLTIQHFTTAEAGFPVFVLVMTSLETALIGGRLGPRWSRQRSGASVP